MMISNILGNKQLVAVVLFCCFCNVQSTDGTHGRKKTVINPWPKFKDFPPLENRKGLKGQIYYNLLVNGEGRVFHFATCPGAKVINRYPHYEALKADDEVTVIRTNEDGSKTIRIDNAGGRKVNPPVTRDVAARDWEVHFQPLPDGETIILVQSQEKVKNELRIGARVKIKDLQSDKAQYNGKSGTICEKYDGVKVTRGADPLRAHESEKFHGEDPNKVGIWRVRIDGNEKVTCKKENLKVQYSRYYTPLKIYYGDSMPELTKTDYGRMTLGPMSGGEPDKREKSNLKLKFSKDKDYPADYSAFINAVNKLWIKKEKKGKRRLASTRMEQRLRKQVPIPGF